MSSHCTDRYMHKIRIERGGGGGQGGGGKKGGEGGGGKKKEIPILMSFHSATSYSLCSFALWRIKKKKRERKKGKGKREGAQGVSIYTNFSPTNTSEWHEDEDKGKKRGKKKKGADWSCCSLGCAP